MGKKRMKQYLMLLMVIGVIAVAASGGGTFASFSAQVTNPGNTFASGTLFLHNTNGATTCTSESNSLNVNPGTGTGGNACAVVFNGIDLGTTTSTTANLALNNAGSVAAQNIKFRVNNCTVTDNSGVTGTGTTFGTAPTCGDFYITVQEKTDGTYATNSFCAFGPGTLATACAAPANTVTLASSQTAGFADLSKDNGSGSAVAANLAAGSTRYYTIRIDANPPSGNNALQNRRVSFDLDWQINS